MDLLDELGLFCSDRLHDAMTVVILDPDSLVHRLYPCIGFAFQSLTERSLPWLPDRRDVFGGVRTSR